MFQQLLQKLYYTNYKECTRFRNSYVTNTSAESVYISVCSSVEACVHEVVVLVVHSDGLREGQQLLATVLTLKHNLTKHGELEGIRR